MARSAKITERERQIGERLRAFRESKLISRSAFAISINTSYQRIESYEAARVPLPYGVFKTIHAKYLISPRWLVTAQGSVTLGLPLDESAFASAVGPRLLLSEVYDKYLEPYLSGVDLAISDYWMDRDGLLGNVAEFLEALEHPAMSKQLPTYLLQAFEKLFSRTHSEVVKLLRERKR